MSSFPRYIPRYTLDDYRQWEGNWELIDGIAIAMTPSPFGPHERVVSRLSRMIGSQLEQKACSCEAYTNLDWIISNDTVIRPDLMVVCGDQPQRHLEKPPVLVVAVLSDATRGSDLVAKRDLYREHQVLHYLIIDPDARSAEHVMGATTCTHSSTDHIELALPGQPLGTISIECDRLFD